MLYRRFCRLYAAVVILTATVLMLNKLINSCKPVKICRLKKTMWRKGLGQSVHPFAPMQERITKIHAISDKLDVTSPKGPRRAVVASTKNLSSNLVVNEPAKTKTEISEFVMSEADRNVVLNLLDILTNVCDRFNIPYFMYGGTLLGSWRHHGMVPWDDDIDIFVNVSYKQTLLRELRNLGPDFKVVNREFQTKFMRSKGKAVKPWPWIWPFIDIEYYLTENGSYLVDMCPSFQNHKFLISDVFPLRKRPFHGRMFDSPRFPLKYLHTIYGFSDECITHYWSHKTEYFQPVVKTKCHNLKDRFPFVHRRFVNGIMEEKLKLGDKVLDTYYVNESRDSLTEPYSLRVIPLK